MSFLPPFLLSNLDEIVFEGRNQAYGAYQLRHDYQRNLASAGGITLLLMAFLLLGWAAWRQLAPVVAIPVSIPHTIEPLLPAATVVIEHPKVVEPAQPHTRAATTHPVAALSTQVAKDEVVSLRPTPLHQLNLWNSQWGLLLQL